MRNFISISSKDNLGISYEIVHNFFAQPSSIRVLQEKREIPVVERDKGFDAVLQTRINDILVMGERKFIDGSFAERENSGPGD